MNIKNKKIFLDNCKKYFTDKYNDFLESLNKNSVKSFFINEIKNNREDILKLIDFDYEQSKLNPLSYTYNINHISNTLVYNLGLIYPQGIESSYSSYLFNKNNIYKIVDLCSAPGGKSINFINKFKDAQIIANDINYNRAKEILNNFERLGIDNAIVTSTDTVDLSNRLPLYADLVILDAPCSGEGMIRKTDDVFDEYSNNYIDKMAKLQSMLLEDAYKIMNYDSYLIYSTCTYSFKEDEDQIISFINKHNDLELIKLDSEKYMSRLDGCVKLSFLNNTEGQFISLIHKKGDKVKTNIKYLKNINNKIVDDFIKNNLNIDKYFLYENNNKYYLSFEELPCISNILRCGILIGEIEKNRFIPNHFMYRANSLRNKYKYEYQLNDKEYYDFINGLELKLNINDNNYYHLIYKGYSVGFGKLTNNILKNKYPKALRI